MRNRTWLAVAGTLTLLAGNATAAPVGKCKDGFADGTRVRTQQRGEMTIGEVAVGDAVWSFNEAVGKPGWSTIQRREDRGQHYVLLSDFSEPGSAEVTKACWRIRREA